MKTLNRERKNRNQKLARKTSGRGQAMVEFALVFPILLLVVVGLLEVGRLIFIYGSVVTASREAARYGSAAGLVSADTNFLRYQDCGGITQRARDVTFLTNDADLTVTIQYDSGPGSSIYHTCTPNADGFDDSFDVSPDNGTPRRILVTVSTVYTPLVPVVVPQLTTFTIETTTARTFLGVIEYWP